VPRAGRGAGLRRRVGLYFLGAAYGVRAAFEASAERKFWAAFEDGLRAVKQHRKVVRLDPGNFDALLTVGMYHYVVGSIPQPFRAIAMLAGIRGSRKQGIEELELVARSGVYNRTDARILLVALYRYEGQPRKALEELEALSRAYPENVPLRLESASLLAQMKEHQAARRMFEDVLRGSDRRLLDVTHYEYGEALAREGAYGGAAEQFRAAAEAPGAYEGLVGAALLRSGQMYDLAGERGEALRMYRACLPQAGAWQRKVAERLMLEPFRLP
jgi:tetratricopeptide (TPR) repeat protein